MTPTDWADKPTVAAGLPVRQHSTPVKQRLLAVSEADDPRKITRSNQVLDQEAVSDLAQTIEKVIEDFRQASGKLTQMLDQAQRSRSEAEQASAKLEQRLGLGVRLLRGLEERTKSIGAATRDLDERQRRTEQAESQLQQQFAKLSGQLDAAAARIEQQMTDTSEAMLRRASAVAQIAENAETNVALMAGRIAEALADVSGRRPIDAPQQAPPPAVCDVEDSPKPHETKDTVQADPVPSSATNMDDLVSATTNLEGELDESLARRDRLKQARPSALGSQEATNQFLTEMSSELRTPIEGVIGMIELLSDTKLDDEQQQYLKTAEFALDALSSLMESVLDLSNIDDGEILLEDSVFDVRSTILHAVNMLTPCASKKGIELVHCIASEVPTLVRGDPGRLRQVLLYSMNRAIKFTEQGQVSLDVAVDHTTHSDVTLRFDLRHEGTTILESTLAAGLHADTGSDGHAGFGLGICGKLVQLMRGDFGIQSDQDQGGFTIWFRVILAKPSGASDDRRAHARLKQEALQCNLGEVIDLSLGGMQIRCTRIPEENILQVEMTHEGETIKVQAEIVRSNKVGFRKHELGLRFLNVDPETAKQLTRLSLNYGVRHTLGDK